MRGFRYIKNIYCLEGNWNTNPKSNQSIKPILEILKTTCGIRYIHIKCDTKADLLKYLRQFTFKRYKNYKILYIAFHGKSNRIYTGKDYTSLKEFGEVLESSLDGKIIHFGSCSTLKTCNKHIQHFLNITSADSISGYSKTIDFIDSTALDLLYFKLLQNYKHSTKAQSELLKQNPELNFNLGAKFHFSTKNNF